MAESAALRAPSIPGTFARAWAKAVSGTSYLPMPQAQLEALLQRLADQLAAALRTEPFDVRPGHRVGTELVANHIASVEGLGRTVEVLQLRLIRDLGLVGDDVEDRMARLLDAVAVMDRLASPGGDPWKRAQTHESLARFLLEESYEAYDAISAGDTDALREELGDVLLQVVLHARLAEELPEGERWNVDDVAGGLVDKMIRRNPHVFAGVEAETLEEITANWDRIKRAEKPNVSVLDGVALSQPALALAAKVLERADRFGLAVPP
ncbi:MazG family protein, partial [Micromonospora azadirachtae]